MKFFSGPRTTWKGKSHGAHAPRIHLVVVALIFMLLNGGTAAGQSSDLVVLINGNILTLDAKNTVASSVRIRNGFFVSVDDATTEIPAGAEVIDLDGRTVIPGLIDSHMHFIRATLRPGHDMREIEAARSIEDLLAAITAKSASVPKGELITAIGGWDPIQFLGENRFPTLAELDAAAPSHPVYVHLRATGPAATNTPGKRLLENAGIEVSDSGLVAAGNGPSQAVAAFEALKELQTAADRERGMRDLMRYANSLGLTTIIDAAGTERPGAQLFDPDHDYETLLALWRKRAMTVRIRPMFMSWDKEVGDGSGDSDFEQRIRNSFMGFGDDMLKVAGLGEHTTGDSEGQVFRDVTRLAAENGWLLSQHSGTIAENEAHVAAFEAADDVESIAPLHWSLAHVHDIEAAVIERLKSLGAGVTVQVHRYLNRGNVTSGQGGPPYRLLVDSGISVGAGTDSTNAQPMNPWIAIYYMVSGRNVVGHVVNEGQTISRLDALRLYTLGSAWFAHDEHQLGSIEVGKRADLVVLSDAYLAIPEEQISDLTSVLTMVNGQIVYSKQGKGQFQ